MENFLQTSDMFQLYFADWLSVSDTSDNKTQEIFLGSAGVHDREREHTSYEDIKATYFRGLTILLLHVKHRGHGIRRISQLDVSLTQSVLIV
jgi:hypothetical protein